MIESIYIFQGLLLWTWSMIAISSPHHVLTQAWAIDTRKWMPCVAWLAWSQTATFFYPLLYVLHSSLRSDAFYIAMHIWILFYLNANLPKILYRAPSLLYVNFLQAWFEESNRRILLLSIKVVKTWIGSALEWRFEHWVQLSLDSSWSLDHSCWISWCWFIPHLRNHLHYPHQLVSKIHWYTLHHSHSALCFVSGWYLFICSPHSKERI